VAKEIERKFLVKGDFKKVVAKSQRIIQGYISSVPQRTVRVRIIGEKGILTIKGIGSKSGASRYEFEKQITPEEAGELLKICEPGIIDKTRFLIEFENHIIEVDEFHGDNKGLVIAEIELKTEDEKFGKPVWLGEEVTGIVKYYNSMLVKNPYKNWENKNKSSE